MNEPNTPFSTRLSGSAKELELRLRNIFQWKKKRPPVIFFLLAAVIALSCGSLVSCEVEEPEQPAADSPAVETADPGLEDDTVVLDVLAEMAAVRAENLVGSVGFWGSVTAEQLAAALNAAVDDQISEEKFLSYDCANTQIFPHWYIEYAFLVEGGSSSLDRHLSICCGLPENIVEVRLSENNQQNTAYFENGELYWLVREKDSCEGIDAAAYGQFEELLVAQMEHTLEFWADNPGNFSGYELKRFSRVWTCENETDGSQVELYDFVFGLLTDTPETVGWAGGMSLDSHLRVVNVGEPKYFAVKYRDAQVVSTAFMGVDYQIGKSDQDKERVNSALAAAEEGDAAGRGGMVG